MILFETPILERNLQLIRGGQYTGRGKAKKWIPPTRVNISGKQDRKITAREKEYQRFKGTIQISDKGNRYEQDRGLVGNAISKLRKVRNRLAQDPVHRTPRKTQPKIINKQRPMPKVFTKSSNTDTYDIPTFQRMSLLKKQSEV